MLTELKFSKDALVYRLEFLPTPTNLYFWDLEQKIEDAVQPSAHNIGYQLMQDFTGIIAETTEWLVDENDKVICIPDMDPDFEEENSDWVLVEDDP